MKIKILIIAIFLFLIVSVSSAQAGIDLVDYVDPFIGTGFHGHTHPGVQVPFGMVQVGSDTGTEGWDWCSGYHYSDSSIIGFSHTHLSGTGVGDLGDFLFIPCTGKLKLDRGTKEDPDKGYRSRFSHNTESASPGYYRVILDDYNVKVELTASKRVAFHKYTFQDSGKFYILIDLVHSIYGGPEKTKYAYLRVENDSLITGYRITRGWAKNRNLYFAARFSKPYSSYSLYDHNEDIGEEPEISSEHIKAVLKYKQKKDEVLLVKVALSPVSTANAIENLNSELPHWDFDKAKEHARQLWANQLSKIEAEADDNVLTTFYTAMYHSMLIPTIHMDVNSEYRGLDKNTHKADGFTNYTVFSLWDTFRALHPLFTITEPERTRDMVKSMLAHYNQSAHQMLPIWSLQHNETWCMIGYHSVPVIVDAYSKGLLNDISAEKLVDAVVTTAQNEDYNGLGYYMKMGYVPIDKVKESASKTLAYCYDDWCIAKLAKDLGKEELYQEFLERSQNFRNIYDPETGFMRAKLIDGSWREPFDPVATRREEKWDRDYTEGNAWQWLWFVPHDVKGLIDLVGGTDKFIEKLDGLFSQELIEQKEKVSDVTGLIGNYAHGNEPSHHIPYLYAMAGHPWKTQELVKNIMNNFYTDKTDGLIGNEDCGQMSAWYILSSLGFYPVNPCGGIYIIGSPHLSSATINLPHGNKFEMVAKNLSKKNIYIQSAKLNGETLDRIWITHDEIIQGGKLEFTMGDKPNKDWGAHNQDIPNSNGR